MSVKLDRKGRTYQATAASYVVGCDGAHSAVRHLLNLPFEGAEYNDTFMLADVETNETLPADELQLCPSERAGSYFPDERHSAARGGDHWQDRRRCPVA